MKYFDYAVKYIIRRVIRIILKPKVLLIFLSLFLLLLFFTQESKAATISYGSIYDVYDSVNTDLITRIKNATGISTDGLKSALLDNQYGYYVYYGEQDGTSQNSTYFSNSDDMWVVIFPITATYHSDGTDRSYHGFSSTNLLLRDYEKFYHFEKNNLSVELGGVTSVIMPQPFFGYRSPVLYQFLNSSSRDETDDIVSSIDKNTNTIENQTQVQQETQDFIKDDTIDNDSMIIDTSSFDTSGESEVDNFFTNFLNIVYNAYTGINSSVETITIPLPHGLDSLVLSSDMISKHIVGTFIYDLIQVFWTFLLGGYLVMFVKRLFDWLSTGKIAEKGVFSFIEWLDIHNEIIKSYMM